MLFPYFKDKEITPIVPKEVIKFNNKYIQNVLNIQKPFAETNGSYFLALDSSGISRFRKTRLFSRSFCLSGIKRIAGLASLFDYAQYVKSIISLSIRKLPRLSTRHQTWLW
jgi:hypothetical protein